ncbi:MAG: amidase domain-containing protein [Clostridiales bacterium]|nr:amidase domain-containing protein [Clostridiales bacterium]
MKTKLFAILFTAILIMPGTAVSAAGMREEDSRIQRNASDYLYNFVADSYGEYYTIDDWSAKIFSISADGGETAVEAEVAYTKTLKARSADELPYMKAAAGVKAALSDSAKRMGGPLAKLSALQLSQAASLIDKDIAFQQSELKQYIGAKQNCTNRFKLTFNTDSLAVDANSLQVFYGVDYFPKEDFYIDSEAVMTQGITEKLTAQIAQEASSPIKATVAANLPVYHRLTARAYAQTYWKPYNTAYPDQNPNGGDCANFVSQCIFAGGIPKDNLWSSTLNNWTVSWVNTGKNAQANNAGLWRYMTNNQGTSGKQYFYECLRSQAAAGGFILWKTGYSHVAFIVANDTVTMQYNAHNYDQHEVSFSTSEFANNDYRFFFSTNYAND